MALSSGKFVPVSALATNDCLHTFDGQLALSLTEGCARVVSLTSRDGTFPVYDLEVEEDHTFTVTRLGIVVHNTGHKACDLVGELLERTKGLWSASELRKLAGIANGGESLKIINGKWFKGTHGSVGIFPKQIADRMRGRRFNNWDEFREVFWKEVSSDPNLATQFSKQNLIRMQNGRAPFVHKNQALEGQKTYQIHHRKPIHDGGGVYEMDNHVIVSPRYHKEILSPSYHYNK